MASQNGSDPIITTTATTTNSPQTQTQTSTVTSINAPQIENVTLSQPSPPALFNSSLLSMAAPPPPPLPPTAATATNNNNPSRIGVNYCEGTTLTIPDPILTKEPSRLSPPFQPQQIQQFDPISTATATTTIAQSPPRIITATRLTPNVVYPINPSFPTTATTTSNTTTNSSVLLSTAATTTATTTTTTTTTTPGLDSYPKRKASLAQAPPLAGAMNTSIGVNTSNCCCCCSYTSPMALKRPRSAGGLVDQKKNARIAQAKMGAGRRGISSISKLTKERVMRLTVYPGVSGEKITRSDGKFVIVPPNVQFYVFPVAKERLPDSEQKVWAIVAGEAFQVHWGQVHACVNLAQPLVYSVKVTATGKARWDPQKRGTRRKESDPMSSCLEAVFPKGDSVWIEDCIFIDIPKQQQQQQQQQCSANVSNNITATTATAVAVEDTKSDNNNNNSTQNTQMQTQTQVSGPVPNIPSSSSSSPPPPSTQEKTGSGQKSAEFADSQKI